ncbi:MAG: 16S rRNA (adenine(1518)-N(6)/adenine(1519)-N(6))-dimethyltransferase, partial [bacterium]|nr:16S rRNA (adenine(1518)-N(6)/adenine(1519)-N(6))-dimethyltransferase [bacterium]
MNTKRVISENNFHIKKKFGQNFLTDKKILDKIVSSADIDNTIGVIEIGPGLGVLTTRLCEAAKHVLAYEIDSELIPILEENLKDYSNKTILNIDILEADVERDIKMYLSDCSKVYVVANLPYYITTPILLSLLQNAKIDKYVVMMQLEVADR